MNGQRSPCRVIFLHLQNRTVATMRVGVSLSPGGLLLPYHIGVLDSLQYNGFVTPDTPVAGSSAGAIATASHGCGVDSKVVLEASIDISDRCKELGGARGRLLPLLEEKLELLVTDEEFYKLQERQGDVGIAYRELFPFNRSILQNKFKDKHDLIRAVCHSSIFPFFTTNWPCHIDTSGKLPRLVVDGFFTVPREKFGCPDFSMAGIEVDRTVMVSPFPKELVGLAASSPEDCICPEDEGGEQGVRLLKLATEASSRDELTALYESGWEDAEKWFHAHADKSPTTLEGESLVLN